MTIGGIYGTVVNVQKELDEVTITVDENTNTKLRMQRAAIARVLASDGTASEDESINSHVTQIRTI